MQQLKGLVGMTGGGPFGLMPGSSLFRRVSFLPIQLSGPFFLICSGTVR
jgi:hypothetical protein